MNALQSYSSDEESENESQCKVVNKMGDPGTNYDDVGMDISEDSDEGKTSRSTSKQNANKKVDDCNKQNKEIRSCLQDVTKYSDKKDSNYRRRDRSTESSTTCREIDDKHDSRRGGERCSKELVSSNRNARDRKDHRAFRRSSRDDRYSRKTRSRSRDRRRSRSRSRSRDRRRRSHSRDSEQKKPHELRKEAQQRLATFKALNPDYDHSELLRRGLEAQFAEVQKTTGVTLPSYYNPAVMNPVKIAEQERKKKLLWGNKSKPVEVIVPEAVIPSNQNVVGGDPKQAGIWANTKFSNDSDGKMAEKFKRLMGVKAPGAVSCLPGRSGSESKNEQDILQKQETMFTSMEKQYEVARLTTHAHKGFGLGFSSQPYIPKQ